MNALVRLFLFVGLLTASAVAHAVSYPDQGSAYTGCLSATQAYVASRNNPRDTGKVQCVKQGAAYFGQFETRTTDNGPLIWAQAQFHEYPAAKTCSVMPPLSGGWFRVGATSATCSGGCAFSGGGGGQTMTLGGRTYQTWNGATPTGAVCSGDEPDNSKPVEADDCAQTGTLTQCVTPQGKHCTVASTGKKFCWEPTEAGTKVSGNEAATKSPADAVVNPPSKPPANGGQWTQTGSSTATVTSGGTTNNYNVTNHQSTYGPQGNGGGAEGEGEGGDGEGDQPGWTKGDPPPRADTGGDDEVTRFGINVGPDMLDQTPIFGSGSCPSFPSITIMGRTVNVSADIPQWCQLVAIMRAVILIMCAFAAIKILLGGVG